MVCCSSLLSAGVDVMVRTGWSEVEPGGTQEVVVLGVFGFGEIVLTEEARITRCDCLWSCGPWPRVEEAGWSSRMEAPSPPPPSSIITRIELHWV
jgi:hypothetical protein